jgi:DNA polymerase-3 subunit delta'
MELSGSVIVTSRFEEVVTMLEEKARGEGIRLIPIVKDGNFKVEDAETAIEKAYLASEERQIILLAADAYSDVVQNKLLKVIEEPPPKKEFILLFRSKSVILPTIRSRLPVIVFDEIRNDDGFELNLAELDIRSVYEFVQSHGRVDASEAKRLAEGLVKEAVKSRRYDLDEKSLDLFRNGILALDMGSPTGFVLTAIMLKLLARKRKKHIVDRN